MDAWRRNQRVMAAAVFAVYTGFAFVLPFLPLYVRELGVADDEAAALWAGVLIGVAPLLAGLLAPAWGRLADRRGQKPMALVALSAYVLLLVLSARVTSVVQLLLLRAGIGLFGAIGPLSLAMATALAPREQTGRALGSIQAAQILAAAVGPLAGGAFADTIGIRATFLATAALCLVAWGLVLLFYKEGPRSPAARAERAHASLRQTLAVPQVVALLVILFFVNFIGRSFTPILPAHLRSLGVLKARLASSTGLLISVYSAAAALSALAMGRASQSFAPARLLLASLVGGAVTVLPMALVPSFPPMLACAALLGLASGGALTLCYTIGGLAVPAERRATAYGFFSGAALFGGALSPSAAGLLARFDLKAIYYANAALFALLAAGVAIRRLDAPD